MMAHDQDLGDESPAEHEARASGVFAAMHGGEREREPDMAPMAVESEAAVLAHALFRPEAATALATGLTIDHFYSEAHRRIFEAIQTLVRAGRPAQTPHVMDELRRTHRLDQVGRQYLVDAVRWSAEQVPIEASIAHLDDLYRRRQFIRSCQEFTAHGYAGRETTTELLDRAQAAVVALAEGAARRELPVLGGPALAEELPELPWLVPALGIAPGAPVLVAGYGYSRKTLAAQALLLSVAAGKSAWDVYQVRQGPVLHLDYEQGRRLTQERYQRLARAMGVDLAGLPIDVSPLPDMHLDTPGAEAMLSRACRGKAMVLIDSLRAAAPSADENSSEVRRYVDMLGRISERTGATMVLIHHAKKPQKDSGGGVKHAIRGSSALFDACGGIFIFEGEKGEATTVHHEKERNRGQCVSDFGIDAEDIAHPTTGAPNWGLRVVHLEKEQIAARVEAAVNPVRAQRFAETCERVLACVRDNPGLPKRGIRELVDGAKDTVDAAIDTLIRSGRVADRGARGRAEYHAS